MNINIRQLIDNIKTAINLNDSPTIDDAKKWYRNGKLHREDGPAVERADGTKEWYFNGRRHREDGPAFVNTSGYAAWYFHGKCHREDGPAVEYPGGAKSWYRHGFLHREDGPAIEYKNGTKLWYYNNVEMPFFQFLKKIKDPDKKIMLVLKFGGQDETCYF